MPNDVRTLARSAALLGGVLLAALLLAAAIVRLPPIQRWAAAQVAARLPAGVGIERATITLLPPGVRLTRLSFGADGPTAKSVACHLRAAALLAGQIEIGALVIDGAAVTIERTADGTWQLAGAPAPPPAIAAPDGTGSKPAGALHLEALPPVTVRDAGVTFVDHFGRAGLHTFRLTAVQMTVGSSGAAGAPVKLAAHLDPIGQLNVEGTVRPVVGGAGRESDYALNATATAKGVDAQTVLAYLAAVVPGGGAARAQGALDASLTLSGNLFGGLAGDARLTQSSGLLVWDEVHCTAPLALSAHLTTSRDGLVLSAGQLTIAQLSGGRITASDLDAAFAYASGVLELTAGRASVYGGTWTQRGTVTLANPPTYDVTVRADGVACEALLSAITGEHPQYGCERFNADAAVRGPWTGARTVARDAEGSGHFDLRGGTIPSSSIIGAVWQAVVPLVHTGTEPGALGAPTVVDHLTQTFTLHAGRMQTNDLSLVTDDYSATGTGTIAFNGALNLETEVSLTPAGVAKLLTMASLPIPGDPGSLPPIPTHISGSVGDPIIRPEVGHLPMAAVQTLFQGARSAGGVLKDAAGAGLRSLQTGLDAVW